jgi:hypothetical protein
LLGVGVQPRAATALKDALKRETADEIVAFKVWLTEQVQRAYRADLWAAAYLMMGGCSDDMFEYFRLWLVAQGREVFERVLEDPDSLADLNVRMPGFVCQFEDLAYVPVDAYEENGFGDLYERLPRRESVDIDMEEDSEENIDRWMARFPRVAKRWGR